MNTISSTSMTSTNGVTLISLMTARRRRLLPAARCRADDARRHICPLTRARRSAATGSPRIRRQNPQPLRLPVHLGDELIVENSRRNGGNEADRGREQRLGDAGRNHRQRGVLRGRNRLEAGHDAPDRAEQADEGAGRADRRQHQKPALHVLDLARDGDVHHLFDAHLQAGEASGRGPRSSASIRAWRRRTARRSNGRAWRRATYRAPPATGPTRTPARSRRPILRMRANKNVLSIAIAQTQTEQTIRPVITVLTSQWACQNRWNSDRSEEVNGKADAR